MIEHLPLPPCSVLITHFHSLLRAHIQCEGPISADGNSFKGKQKNPQQNTQKNPKTKSEQSTSAGNLVLNVKIKHRESFHSPSSKSFMYFQAFFSVFIPSMIVLAIEKQKVKK